MNTKQPGLQFCAVLGLFACQACFSATSSTSPSTPTRGDALAAGDKIILDSDTPIFTIVDPSDSSKTLNVCAPLRTQIEIASAPTTQTSTDAGAAATTTTTSKSETTVTATAATAGQQIKTTVKSIATATVLRVGPRFYKKRARLANQSADNQAPIVCKDPTGDGPLKKDAVAYATVKEGVTYQFTPSDLDDYKTQRFGWTYGALVVPSKVIVSSREFISSASVLPYVGYETWAPGSTGALVLAAGVGTAPASAQKTGSGTPPTNTNASTGTKATFSVATGFIWSFGGGTFKGGLVVGVDTQASNSGYKYQGKPWIGLTLGAGT